MIIIDRKRNRVFWAALVAVVVIAAAFSVWFISLKNNPPGEKAAETAPAKSNLPAQVQITPIVNSTPLAEKIPPPPVSMDRLKRQGCVADGLLTQYNPDSDEFVSLINRSNCYYLHRAIETWLSPPDFEKIQNVMSRITKKDVVYGMFIAEAISTQDGYKDSDSGYEFDFRKMCHQDQMYRWGEHSCVPTFSSAEYRKYIEYITHKAIDLGVQSFMFGQIYMQESENKNYAPRIVKDIRDYAKKKNVDVIIGAQTGSIANKSYLGIFDYIEGGVGIDSGGQIESGPCLTKKGSCWALLWNNTFSSKAKNVLLNLDWTGVRYDDLDIFARMSPQKRAETLKSLYAYFTAKNMAFMMPYFGVLNGANGGCYGPKKGFYSPSDAYGCKDEKIIDAILAGKK